MTFTKGSLVAALGAAVTIILFFLGPWLDRGVGPLNLGSVNGFTLAGQMQPPILYGIPIVGVLALVVIYVIAAGTVDNRIGSVVLILLGLVPIGYLLYTASNMTVVIVSIPVQQIGWGLWATLIALGLVVVGGLMNLLSIDGASSSGSDIS